MRPRSRKIYPTPDEAETAFYDAFERGDLAAMMAVWAEGDDIVCVHPQGPRITGFEAIRESWMQIFSSGVALRVKTAEVRRMLGQTIAVHNVLEMLSTTGAEASASSVCATNVYVLTENGWRLAIHHASPAPENAQPEEEPAPAHTLH